MNDGDRRSIVRNQPVNPYGRSFPTASQPTNLADLLERVLDKGIVIAGDITLALATVDILTLKIRLLIASVDKAQEIGINWWQSDPALSSRARELEEERDMLRERLDRLEARLALRDEEEESASEPEEPRKRRRQR
jgi:hypothetical protein